MYLAAQQQRVDDDAEIVDHEVAQDRDVAGLRVDFDFGDGTQLNGSLSNTLRYGPLQLYGLLSMERGAWFGNSDRAYRIRQGGADEYLKLLDSKGNKTFAADSMFQWASILNYNDKRDNVRIKELSVTYQIPEHLSGMVRAGRTTLTLSGQNLNWWDSCNCVDPNMNWAGADSFGVGSGFLAQPSPRLYRLQIRTKF